MPPLGGSAALISEIRSPLPLAQMQEEPMTRQLTKQIFGVPSTETASRIDDSDATNAACAASYRFNSRMRELEAQFEAKASRVARGLPGRACRTTRRGSSMSAPIDKIFEAEEVLTKARL
jgi:hypothetical protein